MRSGCSCFLLCAGLIGGCANPQPLLTQVDPAQANAEADVSIVVTGGPFVPTSTVNPVSGARSSSMDGFHLRLGKGNVWAELEALAWIDVDHLSATLTVQAALGLPSGLLDLQLVDPRGQRVLRADAFDELGPDREPPTVVFTCPDSVVIPRMRLQGTIVASDADGHVDQLTWTYAEAGREGSPVTCIPPESPCAFSVTISDTVQPGDQVTITADAQDASAMHNHRVATLPFIVQPIPTIVSFTPDEGGTAGGTDVLIVGNGMVKGQTRASVDGADLFPDGGLVSDDGRFLSGHMPPHAAGPVRILLTTYDVPSVKSRDLFTYAEAPQILSIQPATGSSAGGTPVVIGGQGFSASTRIFFGSTLQAAQPLADLAFQAGGGNIIGHTPGGHGLTTVWAVDDVLGFSALPNAFTWEAP